MPNELASVEILAQVTPPSDPLADPLVPTAAEREVSPATEAEARTDAAADGATNQPVLDGTSAGTGATATQNKEVHHPTLKDKEFWSLPAPIPPRQPYPTQSAIGYEDRESASIGDIAAMMGAGVVCMTILAYFLGFFGERKKRKNQPKLRSAERPGESGNSPRRPF